MNQSDIGFVGLGLHPRVGGLKSVQPLTSYLAMEAPFALDSLLKEYHGVVENPSQSWLYIRGIYMNGRSQFQIVGKAGMAQIVAAANKGAAPSRGSPRDLTQRPGSDVVSKHSLYVLSPTILVQHRRPSSMAKAAPAS